MKINNLKIQREKLGLTQIEVARKAKISERSYQYIEAGERVPNVITAIKIAEALKSTCEKLFKVNTKRLIETPHRELLAKSDEA